MRKIQAWMVGGVVAAWVGAAIAVLPFASPPLKAGFIPQVTGAQDPSQFNATINGVIQSVNNNVGSLTATGTAFATAAGTAEQTAAQYTIPGNLIVAGSTVRQTCWGTAANNANVKTSKLYFGTSSASLIVTASAATQWLMEAVTIATGTAAQTTVFRSTNTAVAPAISNAAGTDNTASGTITTKCTLTDATSSAADLTMQGYLVEIVH